MGRHRDRSSGVSRAVPRVPVQRHELARRARQLRLGPRAHSPTLSPAAAVRTSVTPAEAAALIVEHVRPLPVESRPLLEALGAVLAADVRSPIDLPAWDNSAMDGYAVAARDVRPGAVLRVVETVAAGQFPTKPLAPGDATRVFTGAPVPT